MARTLYLLAMLMERESQDASEQEKLELKQESKLLLLRAVDGYAAQVQMHFGAVLGMPCFFTTTAKMR